MEAGVTRTAKAKDGTVYTETAPGQWQDEQGRGWSLALIYGKISASICRRNGVFEFAVDDFPRFYGTCPFPEEVASEMIRAGEMLPESVDKDGTEYYRLSDEVVDRALEDARGSRSYSFLCHGFRE